ncbi:MAG: hypothetical protein J7J86_07615 [Bacteroidales bacterium]|nr:hypothetical protein [Bacteroidales bacterium]
MKRNKIRYLVECEGGSFNVTYKDKKNEIKQIQKIKKRWKYFFRANRENYLYLSAQANSKNAEIKIKIKNNREILKTVTKKGDYCVATASAELLFV